MPLHPGAQAVLDLIAEAGRPSFEEMTVPECREAYVNSRKALQPDPIEIAEVRNLSMPGRPETSSCACIGLSRSVTASRNR